MSPKNPQDPQKGKPFEDVQAAEGAAAAKQESARKSAEQPEPSASEGGTPSAEGTAAETTGVDKAAADALAAAGITTTIVVLEHAARTSAEAAAAVGCDVGQIVKSLVFRLRESGLPLLVLTSGANRVDETKLGALLGESVGRADADFVRAHTGFAIGGVAPLAHPAPLTTLIDEPLLKWEAIWAAGGHPHTVFRLTPDELVRIAGGRVVAVS